MQWERQVDYDIHGIVGIRLVHPSLSDVAAVTRQLGSLQGPLSRDPDIIIRFVPHIATPRLCYLGRNKTGFTDDGFFVLRDGKRDVRVKIPFDQIGKQCEIVCQSGLRSVPLLMAILSLTALKCSCVSVHASAFVHKGVGVLVAGWAQASKTTALLAFAARGAEYVGDDFVLLSGDGQRMYGVPGTIRLSPRHFECSPQLLDQMKGSQGLLVRGFGRFDRVQQKIANGKFGEVFPLGLWGKVSTALENRLAIGLAPQSIFGRSLGPLVAKPEKVFILLSHNEPEICVEPTDPSLMAKRIIASIQYEQLRLIKYYLAFKFAFPDIKSDFMEQAPELQKDIICRALTGKEAYMIRHPYPGSFSHLYDAMLAIVEQSSESSSSSGRLQDLCAGAAKPRKIP